MLGAANPTPTYRAICYGLVSIAVVALSSMLFTILIRKQASKAD